MIGVSTGRLRQGSTDPGRPRIFGIGLNKTATTSLHEALTVLGFRSLHWGGPPVRREVEAARDASEPLLSRLPADLDAFSDIEVLSRSFAVLDHQYPGSRFVLTVRPIDDWVASRRRHVERNQAKAARGEYDGTFLTVDEAAWRHDWSTHTEAVRDHFGGRTDFLEVDLTDGRGWEPLCRLLDEPVPDVAFPWVNQGSGG
ncbi:MAG: sulfotransferase [Acidimicrobiales bacterium]